MRMSRLFGQTLRDAPAEAEITSHKLLLRANFISQLAAGIFSYLPLAKRSISKIENILRDEMNAIGGQEITIPTPRQGFRLRCGDPLGDELLADRLVAVA